MSRGNTAGREEFCFVMPMLTSAGNVQMFALKKRGYWVQGDR